MDIKQLIGETTDYDKKVALETKKPKSWCKSISAFANCYGGKLVFGVANDDALVGLSDAEGDARRHEVQNMHLCILYHQQCKNEMFLINSTGSTKMNC